MAYELSGAFAQPAPQPTLRGKIANALSGFGAGFQGRGIEWQKQQQARQEQLSADRTQAMIKDAQVVYSLLEAQQPDKALQLVDNRIENIIRLGGDPSDTAAVRELIASGNVDAAKQEIGTLLGAAASAGLLQMEQPNIPAEAQTLMIRAQEAGLQPGTPEYQEFMLQGGAQPREPAQPNLQRVSAVVGNEGRPTTLLFDPSSGVFTRQRADGTIETVPSDLVSQVNVQGGMDQVLPPSKADDLVGMRDWLSYQQQEIGSMLEKIRNDPTLAGAAGAIRRVGQTVTGVAGDLASMFGAEGARDASNLIMGATNAAIQAVESGSLSEDQFNKLFNDPNLSELRLFENSLGFTLAQLRTPDSRMLASVINRSLDDAKLTGFTSSKDVINRLDAIYKQFDSRIESLNRRIGVPAAPQQQGQTTNADGWEIVR